MLSYAGKTNVEKHRCVAEQHNVAEDKVEVLAVDAVTAELTGSEANPSI